MSENAANQVQYFLGIEGEQKGPFSHSEIFQMLSAGEINDETQIWTSGMADWVSVGSLDLFKPSVSDEENRSRLSVASSDLTLGR
mgnify:CR=1 FL=1